MFNRLVVAFSFLTLIALYALLWPVLLVIAVAWAAVPFYGFDRWGVPDPWVVVT